MSLAPPAITPRSGAQPRSSAAVTASKYCHCPGSADPSSSERPGSDGGTGAPTAARMVGATSTWRAGTRLRPGSIPGPRTTSGTLSVAS